MNEEKRREEPSPFEVLLIAEHSSPITTTGGMKILPHYTFDSCPRLDILVCPGGWGTRKELKNPVMLEWLRARAPGVETLAAVCTGSMLLGFAGLLDGLHRLLTGGPSTGCVNPFPQSPSSTANISSKTAGC